ncbi:O-antigen ligase family protein [Aquiflexum sp. LQ15W]|uniref:O-antigen ligase family protein n=1 Tax=Cognataquiflexum nitidum TaxID=2922272 RepID=UPI001F130690|nr:O-antigen ligase family protein [Cognataquiflexum nitidum]MCH6199262.1 O-antigen ligase family protein [Cognataquiflexum nitidum]
MNKQSYPIIFSAVLVFFLFFTSYSGLTKQFLGLTLLASFVCFIFNCKKIVLLFLVLIPTNDIFSKEEFLFSIFGLKQILGIFVVLYYFRNYRIISKNLEIIKLNDRLRKVFFSFESLILLLILYFNYTYFKNAFFGLHDFDINTATLKSINMTGHLLACLFSLRIAFTSISTIEINRSMICSILVMITFSFFSPILPYLGFRSLGTEKTEFENIGFERFTGIIADGDSNTLSVYLCITIGICFLFFSYFRKKFTVVLLIPLTILVGVTGSRTGILSLFIVIFIFYFFIRNRNSKKSKIIFLFFIPIVILISFPFFDLILNRFLLIGDQFNLETSSNRIGKWLMYFNFFLDNKITFLTGSQKELLITWDEKYYSAHNAFITMIYNGGLIFSILIYYAFVKIIWISIRHKFYDLLIVVVPSFVLINTVSDLGIIYPMLLYSMVLVKNRFGYELYNSLIFKKIALESRGIVQI